MAGIIGFGSYVPRYRLPREVIAKEWGQPSMGGERAVAGHDEDSLTLAINAAFHALPDGAAAGIDAIYFASTTPPYREKQSAATVAAALDAGSAVRTADVTDSLRAGTSALRAALDAVQGGARRALVCAGDCRMAEPDTHAEQSYGDAGAAMLLGGEGEPVIAEVVGAYSQTEEFLGTWRNDEQDFLHSFPGAFETKFGYAPFVIGAVRGLLEQTGTAPTAIAKAVIAAPNPRAAAGVAKSLKLDLKQQVQDTLWMLVGDTGTAQPLLLLAGALERCAPGELILVVGYGDGADALLLRTTDASTRYKTGLSLFAQIERKRLLPSYGKYARFRKLIKQDAKGDDLSTPIVLFRDRRTISVAARRPLPAVRHGAVPAPPRLHRVRSSRRSRGAQAGAARNAVHVHQRLHPRFTRRADHPRRRRARRRRACVRAAHRRRPRAGRGRHAGGADLPQVPRGIGAGELFLEGTTGGLMARTRWGATISERVSAYARVRVVRGRRAHAHRR